MILKCWIEMTDNEILNEEIEELINLLCFLGIEVT